MNIQHEFTPSNISIQNYISSGGVNFNYLSPLCFDPGLRSGSQ